jgi:hypothetical protein
MRRYEGTCRGGPLDGKDLAHDRSMYRVLVPVFPKPPVASFHPPDEMLPRRLEFDTETHSYVHVLEQWVWQRR